VPSDIDTGATAVSSFGASRKGDGMNEQMTMGLAIMVGSTLFGLLMEWRWRAIDAEKKRLEQKNRM